MKQKSEKRRSTQFYDELYSDFKSGKKSIQDILKENEDLKLIDVRNRFAARGSTKYELRKHRLTKQERYDKVLELIRGGADIDEIKSHPDMASFNKDIVVVTIKEVKRDNNYYTIGKKFFTADQIIEMYSQFISGSERRYMAEQAGVTLSAISHYFRRNKTAIEELIGQNKENIN